MEEKKVSIQKSIIDVYKRQLDLVDAIRVQMEIVLPDKLEQYKKLVVYAKENGKKEVWFSIPVKQLIRRQGMPQYFIESSEVDRKLCLLYTSRCV